MTKTGNIEIISVRIEAEFDTLEQIEKLFGGVDNESPIQLSDGKAELKLITAAIQYPLMADRQLRFSCLFLSVLPLV